MRAYFYFIPYREKIDNSNPQQERGEKEIFHKGLMVLARPVSQELSPMARRPAQSFHGFPAHSG